MRKIFRRVSLSFALLSVGAPLWAQAGSSANPGSSGNGSAGDSPMVAPAPVSGEGYSLEFASETPRTNYLSGGVVLGAAYDQGILSSTGSVNDFDYSVAPTISFDQTRSRFRWDLSYSPGFTFYQKYSDLNQSSQNLGTKFSYRLSPHVTFSAQEAFSKTRGGYGEPCQSGGGVSCSSVTSPNTSIVAPTTDTISNNSTAQLTYQFSPGGMVGVTGNFSQLRYPNLSQVQGLNDSDAAGGSAYYTHRLSGKHYIGVTYQYQKYLTHPDESATETQTVTLFYTFYLQQSLSFSVSGGPQYSDSSVGGIVPLLPLRTWSPSGGVSVNWQGQHSSLAASYSRRVSDGGGLQGAVNYNGADASIRHQFSPTLSGTVSGDYSVNKVLDPQAQIGGLSGHSISGTVTLQRKLGEHFNATAGYLRLHQSYDVTALSLTPTRDRVWLSIAYQFQRPLGR